MVAEQFISSCLGWNALQDPARPLPTVTFDTNYTMTVGGLDIELSWIPGGHTKGDIFCFIPDARVVMFVDNIQAGWTMFRYVLFGDPEGCARHLSPLPESPVQCEWFTSDITMTRPEIVRMFHLSMQFWYFLHVGD